MTECRWTDTLTGITPREGVEGEDGHCAILRFKSGMALTCDKRSAKILAPRLYDLVEIVIRDPNTVRADEVTRALCEVFGYQSDPPPSTENLIARVGRGSGALIDKKRTLDTIRAALGDTSDGIFGRDHTMKRIDELLAAEQKVKGLEIQLATLLGEQKDS